MTVQFDLGAEPVTPRDAATVVLLRDGPGGLEVFFVKRRAEVRFMGGAYVFPGGKLDDADRDPSVPCDLDGVTCAQRLQEPEDPDRARGLHVAALRECLEEAGVLFSHEAVSPETVAALRHACDVEKHPLRALLPARGITLRASALVPLSRWITPRGETRRFDARFFLAAAPEGVLATHDNTETVASEWLSPVEALARAHREEIVLVPPTYRTVQLLAHCPDVKTALESTPKLIPTLEPRVLPTPQGEMMVVLPGDPLHPEPAPVMRVTISSLLRSSAPFATRFIYDRGAWRCVDVTVPTP